MHNTYDGDIYHRYKYILYNGRCTKRDADFKFVIIVFSKRITYNRYTIVKYNVSTIVNK